METTTTRKPIAVIISDVHYSVPTLEVADAAMRQAVSKSDELHIPLIVAGDLHDTKASMRGECVNAMIKTFSSLKSRDAYILIGNHDKINEKSEAHSLNFLRPFVAKIINTPCCINLSPNIYFIPYQHDTENMRSILSTIHDGATLVIHQGVTSANTGEYAFDRSAVPIEWFANYRTISGHYHPRQDIKCGRPRKGAIGLFSYIGNPYTLTFGEAHDPAKGFQILYDDGLLDFCPTSLRKHVVIEGGEMGFGLKVFNEKDLVLVRISAPKDELAKVSKKLVAEQIGISQDFKLELISNDAPINTQNINLSKSKTEILDNVIDSMSNTDTIKKERLKSLWRNFTEGNK